MSEEKIELNKSKPDHHLLLLIRNLLLKISPICQTNKCIRIPTRRKTKRYPDFMRICKECNKKICNNIYSETCYFENKKYSGLDIINKLNKRLNKDDITTFYLDSNPHDQCSIVYDIDGFHLNAETKINRNGVPCDKEKINWIQMSSRLSEKITNKNVVDLILYLFNLRILYFYMARTKIFLNNNDIKNLFNRLFPFENTFF